MGELEAFKTPIGLQGGVVGWNDPWHDELCDTQMRTGEGRVFPSQDPTPTPDQFIQFIAGLGVEFYLHHVMPDVEEINKFIDSIAGYDLPFLLGNEYGNANGPYQDDNNRYDIPEACVERASATGKFLGLLYDETEHLQLHPNIYIGNHKDEFAKNSRRHQWASPEGKTLQQLEDDVEKSVRQRIEGYGGKVPLFSEQVFPVMYHTLARGGFHLVPKVLKEEFQSLQLSTALGAAKQYGRQMGICVDLWGQDVGPWFTRLCGFPAHSPREYKSALEMAYLMGPRFMFTENVDPLARFANGHFQKTEFGHIFEEFMKKFVPEHPRYYDHTSVDPDIVLIRSDDTDWRDDGTLYGSAGLHSNKYSQSAFHAFHLLSRGALPPNGATFFLPQYEYPAARYPRNAETLSSLPLLGGVSKEEETNVHKLFYPMNNVAVFDERVTSAALGNPKLILIAGSRITQECLNAVAARVRDGAVCVAARWLMPAEFSKSRRDGEGRWIVTDHFLDFAVRDEIDSLLGEQACWMQRFGNYEVRFHNDNGDGITLSHEVAECPGNAHFPR